MKHVLIALSILTITLFIIYFKFIMTYIINLCNIYTATINSIKLTYTTLKKEEAKNQTSKLILILRCLQLYKIFDFREELKEKIYQLDCVFSAYKYHRENTQNLEDTITVLVVDVEDTISYNKINYETPNSVQINGKELECFIFILKDCILNLYENSIYKDEPMIKELYNYYISKMSEIRVYIWKEKQIGE